MIEVISRSKINLNFLWTSAEKDRCTIKGRTLELSACRSFQLSNHTDEFANYGFIDGKNIATFHHKQDVLDKINYYLNHGDEREAIADRAFEHVLQNHTWMQRFQDIFKRLENTSNQSHLSCQKYRILLLVRDGVRHQIRANDERLSIYFADPESDWKKIASDVDGVVWVDQESTLNHESLYMMAFGLVADKSDVIAANFYTGSQNSRYWIRFIDRIVDQRKQLLQILPAPCLMFSGKYAAVHGSGTMTEPNTYKVSYIEYPSFWIKLSYYQSRILRLYFAYHGNSRQQFKKYIRSFKFGCALSLGMDKIWQKILRNRIGA